MEGLITLLALLVALGPGFLFYSSPAGPPEMTEAEIAQIEAAMDTSAGPAGTLTGNTDAQLMESPTMPPGFTRESCTLLFTA